MFLKRSTQRARASQEVVRVALAGCPNVGKTSLFNVLTGTKQYVANWPGVTVEKKEGFFTHRGYRINLVDLPGTYSLGYSSIDEKIARDYLLKGNTDIVVVVGDSVNPEQSLYLLLEILEMEKKVILALTAIDEAEKTGIKIDRYELQKHLGVPVVFTSAVTGKGIEKLKDRIVEYYEEKDIFHRVVIRYGEKIESEISQIESVLRGKKIRVNPRYFALKYLSGDPAFYGEGVKLGLPTLSEEERIGYRLLISRRKREYVESIVKEAYSDAKGKSLSSSEAIDHVLTHKFLAFPLFFALMYLVFKFTFDIAQVFADLLDSAFSYLGSLITTTLGENVLTSLLSDGIIGGLGSVLVFVPNIFAMFLALGFLEESGYLPRAAFVMDRIMEKFKLSGRAFMSLILGFGCNVPSIMATRSIDDPQERLVTILIAPFMSCSARLPVYLLILRIFFPNISAAM
ncbi:ferrous iron transport protein B, partial [Thermotoga sp.]|uniref:ferrous iron transport protein B n=1 Tax=Thermotoga sp. TaxID=28240 RepID=UPI0025F26096